MCVFRLIVLLIRALSRVHHLYKQFRPDLGVQHGLNLSFLGRLPPDLIIYITRFLPPDAAASFALCCYSIYTILGTRYWEALRTQDQQQQRLAFLTLLERDLPQYIVCYPCRILHLPHEESLQNWAKQPTRDILSLVTPCSREHFRGRIYKYIHLHFRFSNFQMAMKRYRLGLPYSDHLSRLGCDRTDILLYQHITHAKIIAGSLILRIQYIFLTPLSQIFQIPPSGTLSICPHTETSSLNIRALEDIRCKVKHNHYLGQCTKGFKLKQCCRCLTEYQVDLQECGQRGSLIAITKWLDLGEGRNWADFKWQRHLHQPGTADRETYPCEVGSIRDSFEHNKIGSFDPFHSPENIDKLCRLLEQGRVRQPWYDLAIGLSRVPV